MKMRVYGVIGTLGLIYFSLSQTGLAWNEADLQRLRETRSCINGDLREASLEGCDLRGTSLRGSDLRGANLKGANLFNTDLYDTDLRSVQWAEGEYENLLAINPYAGVRGRIRLIETRWGKIDLSSYRREDMIAGKEGRHEEIFGAERIGFSIPTEFPDHLKHFISGYLLETFGEDEQDFYKAREHYHSAGQKGFLPGFNNLAFMYEIGVGGDRNIFMAYELYKMLGDCPGASLNRKRLIAMEIGTKEATFEVAQIYEREEGERSPLSRYWYKKSANRGSFTAARKVHTFSKSMDDMLMSFNTLALVVHSEDAYPHFLTSLQTRGMEGKLKSVLTGLKGLALTGNAHAAFDFYNFYRLGKAGIYPHEKDYLQAVEFLKIAAMNGHVQAVVKLADFYRDGYFEDEEEIVIVDTQKALFLYQYAMDNEGKFSATEKEKFHFKVGKILGDAHGEKEMRDLNPSRVFAMYSISAASGNLTSALNIVHLLRLQKNYQEALTALQHAQDIPVSGEGDGRLLYMQAQHHEQEWGVPQNLIMARKLYGRAAATGLIFAHLKLQLLDASETVQDGEHATQGGEDITIQEAYEESQRRLVQELECQYVIRDVGGQVVCQITEDFAATQSVLHAKKERNKRLPLQVNMDFISADPYVRLDSKDVAKEISDERITPPSLADIASKIQQDMKQHSDYEPSFEESFVQIMRQHIFNGTAQPFLLKHFVKMYDAYGKTPGRIGTFLVRHKESCKENLDASLYKLELFSSYATQSDIPLGARIGQIFLYYKAKFLGRYDDPYLMSPIEANQKRVFLWQRMRLPLGLQGSFMGFYSPMEQNRSRMPSAVMKTFLTGGQIFFEHETGQLETRVKPYTSSLMVDLLSQEVTMSSQTLKAAEDKERLLTGEDIFQEVQRDPFLKNKFEQAFRTMEDNEYFRVTPREDLATEKGDKYSSLYTRELYEYFLLKTRHLVKGPKNLMSSHMETESQS